MLTAVLLTLVGLVLLAVAADRVVADASALAARVGVSPFVVGLTVVSIGTSLPEVAIGISDVLAGGGEITVGTIVGSNLANLLLVLGIAAILAPVALEPRLIRTDLPAMILAALLLLVLALDGELGVVDGVLLLGYAAGYFALVATAARRGTRAPTDPEEQAGRLEATTRPWHTTLTLLLAMAALVAGAELLVGGASDLAGRVGASDALVGLTVVAIGTSAPELVTVVVATFRGGRDVALGNVVGSSVLNIALVLGVTVVAALGIAVPDEVLEADLLLMVVAVLLCVPVFLTGRRISRAEGILFVAAYAVYLGWLVVTRL